MHQIPSALLEKFPSGESAVFDARAAGESNLPARHGCVLLARLVLPTMGRPPTNDQKPIPPGMAGAMLQSPLRSLCNFRTDVRLWTHMNSRNFPRSLSKRPSSREIVHKNVSRRQPKIFCTVDHQASPGKRFLVERGSLRPERLSAATLGQNIASIA